MFVSKLEFAQHRRKNTTKNRITERKHNESDTQNENHTT